MTPDSGRVTIITVTHNGAAVIGPMLESIPPEIPVMIVDNASSDETLSIARAVRPNAHVIKNSIGLGYGNGMNVGLEKISTEYALMINPDTVISEGAVDKLLRTAAAFPDAGLIGPKVLTPAGEIELSHDVEVHRRSAYGKRNDEVAPSGPICAESLSGAVVLARMSCLRDVGFFDPSYFLYFEDEDMCKMMRAKGYSLIFDPNAVISHHGGGSVPATPSYHWEKFWHMSWSRLYYEKKHAGSFSSLKVFAKDMPKFALKAIGYYLMLNKGKARRDAARCFGMIAYMAGCQASRVSRH